MLYARPLLTKALLLGACLLALPVSDAMAQVVTDQSNFAPPPLVQTKPIAPQTLPTGTPIPPPRPKVVYIPTDDITLQFGLGSPTNFSAVNLPNLSRAYVKLSGVDLADDKLIDDFVAINNCIFYQRYYNDEFSWRQAREAYRKVIQRDIEKYPDNVYILGVTNLGRYDFLNKSFSLAKENSFKNLGLFRINQPPKCDRMPPVDRIPVSYTFRLTNPIRLINIPFDEQKANILTRTFEREGNSERKVYVAFYVRINDFTVNTDSPNNPVREASVRATLLSLRFFKDPERKILLYEYTGKE